MKRHSTTTSISDAEVLDRAAEAISVPRVEEGDSFVLHAPLEVLARSALLTAADPQARDRIRDLISEVADTYSSWGTSDRRCVRPAESDSTTAQNELEEAISTGELDKADDLVAALAAALDVDELVTTLAPLVLPSLAAAAHGPILLHLLPRTAPRSVAAASMARSTIRELARHPTWTLTWLDEIGPRGRRPVSSDGKHQAALAAQLAERLSAPELEHQPGSTSIQPTMAAVDQSGLAAQLLGDLAPAMTVRTARRTLLRLAAQSMLQDSPEHAPYGWSHCLTMPQAALSVARHLEQPASAVAVAGTYVLGFRATLGTSRVDLNFVPEPSTDLDEREVLLAPPEMAAAAAWHVVSDQAAALWRTLITNAAMHPDAHLAKYTLACLDAARSDPGHEQLFRAAAAYLNAWWSQADTTSDS